MNSHQQARLHNRAKARFSLTGARRGLSIALLIVLIVAVMTAWFGFLGWGLIEFLRSLVGFVKYLWSTV
jgi:predicted PurR-regulated permease PerM